MDAQVVADPAWLREARMLHHAVQLLPIHAAQWMQGVEGGHRALFFGSILVLSRQIGVPGEPGRRTAHGSAGSSHSKRLTLHQDLGLQGSDGQN